MNNFINVLIIIFIAIVANPLNCQPDSFFYTPDGHSYKLTNQSLILLGCASVATLFAVYYALNVFVITEKKDPSLLLDRNEKCRK